MKIVDLSHTFDSSTPVYPGCEPPSVTQESVIEKDGFDEKLLTFMTHTGTHIDVPAHMIKGGATIDSLDISMFTGSAYAIDISKHSYDKIDLEFLTPHRAQIEKSDFVILHSGWHMYSWSDTYFSGYPVLSNEAAEWLTGFNLKGIGVDMISVDPVDSSEYRNHLTFFRNGMIIIENLKNTESLAGREFTLHVFPLNISGGDGSPVRAVAFI